MLIHFFPMQTNASSMSLPVNTLDICCHPKASPWPHTKSRSSKIGQYHRKSSIFNLSLASPISTITSFTDILKSQFHLCALPTRVPLGISLISATLPLKHLKRLSPQLWSLPIGSWTLKLQLRLMPPTTHLPLFFQSQLPMASCTQLHSTPGPFPLWNSTMMSMTKSYLQFLKLSNDGNITLKALDFWLMWSLITRICNIFQQPTSSCIDKHIGPNIFLDSISLSISVPENLEPNPMHSLDDGTSILKRGIVTIPVSIHRITNWYSLPRNWHHPSELLPYQSQSLVDLSTWILKGSILTSSINSERIPFLQNTLTISQNHGPWTPMVYYRTLDASMFQIPEISNSMFFSTHTITPLQDISVRQRHSTKSACTTIGLDFLPTP